MPHFLRLVFVSVIILVSSLLVANAQGFDAPRVAKLRPELALQLGHTGSAISMAYSPDGKLLSVSSNDNTIKVWDVASGEVWRTLSGHMGWVFSVAFSPNGKLLASGNLDGIQLWDVASGEVRRTWRTFLQTSVAFSPDGKLLASGGLFGSAVMDVASGEVQRTLGGVLISSVTFSPDGSILAIGNSEAVQLWDVASGKVQRTLKGHRGWMNSGAFSPDGKLLATASQGELMLWDVASGEVQRTLRGHKYYVDLVAFSPNGKLLASASKSELMLWDVASGEVQRTLTGQMDKVHSMVFSPDSELLANGEDNAIKLWDLASGEIQRTLNGHNTNWILSVVFSPDGSLLASGNNNKTVTLWDMARGTGRRTLTGHTDWVNSVAFSLDGKLLASGSRDNTVKLWNVASGEALRTLKHKDPVESVAFSPDGKLLASGTQNGIKLWDVGSGEIRRTLKGYSGLGHSVAFSPDGKLLASGNTDNTIRLWDVASGKVQRTLRGHTNYAESVAFSPDGKLLASGGWDRTVKLWNVATGEELRTLTGQTGWINSVAFSPDGKTLASGSNDTTIRLWDVASGEVQRTLTGHTDWVNSVAFSLDGKLLASGTRDNTIRLWSPGNGQTRATLLALPEITEAIQTQAKALNLGVRDIQLDSDEWFVTTPEGWFDCSANASRFIRWNINNELVPAERYYRRLRRPNMIQQALRGEAVPEPDLSHLDLPPVANFTRLQYDRDKAAETVTITLEVRGRRNFKDVTVLVNGRPLPPENETPIEVSDMPTDLDVRPLDLGVRPLDLGVRPLDLGVRPAGNGSKAVKDTRFTVGKRYTFKVPLPIGASEIKLRASAYDTADVGSNPTEVVLRRSDVKRVPGNLYILCAGIGRYKNGSDGKNETATTFSNLKHPVDDAQAMAQRLQQEGAPLYDKVEIFNGGPLVNEQATLDNLRAGLKWLQGKARHGQIDTVMIFLSGHGLSDREGRYYFPTYDFDKQNWQETSLSGRELQKELGGKVRARAVFLFVDTCHSGALAGSRSDDLNFEVNNSGVYMLASSGASQYSYERDSWGHGAFTLALLRSLARRELVQDGAIRFNVLTYAVPDEIARLMKEVGQNENSEAPVVSLDGRRLDEPVAQVR